MMASDCFQKVFSSIGYRKLSSFRPGELVVTHRGRLRRMNQRSLAKIDKVESVLLSLGNNSYGPLTKNQLVRLADGGWISVGELIVGDRLEFHIVRALIRMSKKGFPLQPSVQKITAVVSAPPIQQVWKLDVEEDHSFVCNGIVYHC